jgi:hypothetical protein
MARSSQPVRPEPFGEAQEGLAEGLSTLVENFAETANRWPGDAQRQVPFFGIARDKKPKKGNSTSSPAYPPEGTDAFFYWADEIQ